MDPRVVLKPDVSEELAVSLARRLYGIQVTEIKRLVSADDQNFHIKISRSHSNPHIGAVNEDGYTLKITNVSKSAVDGHFESMHSTMRRLKSKGLRCPEAVRNLDGDTWTLETVPLRLQVNGDSTKQKKCGVHLLTYIPGHPVSTFSYTGDVLFQWGSLLAKFHNAVQDIKCSKLKKVAIFWNLEHAPEIESFMGPLEDSKRELVMKVLRKYPSEVGKNLESLPKGIIHGDFNETNVLARTLPTSGGGRSTAVDGVLDLEDMHYGTYAWDVGMMLAYTLLDCRAMDPLEGAGHALAGYLSQRVLTELEMSVLKICMECRLCQSFVLCAYSYSKDSKNEYLLHSAIHGWKRLEQLVNFENRDLLDLWKKIRQENYFESMKK